ncbi:MAG: DUF4349 domain-containing protein [Chloroflexi bacterium]|nr:DUF4349 domain-containing protein [Chloroflexota bacterium]
MRFACSWCQGRTLIVFLVLFVLGFVVFSLLSLQMPAARPLLPAVPMAAPLEQMEAVEKGIVAEDARGFLAPQDGVAAAPLPLTQRMVIHNAYVDAYVRDPAAALEATQAWVRDAGGYIVEVRVDTSRTQEGTKARAFLAFRVPAERLEDALAFIRSQAEYTVERVEGQDVTEEYLDLEARLKALRAAQARLEALLQQAKDPQDVLSVYRELMNLQTEIERIEGRMRFLEQSAAYSKVEVTFYPLRERPRAGLQWGDWNLWDTAIRALNALIALIRALAHLAVWVLVFWLPLLLALWLLYRWVASPGITWLARRRSASESSSADKRPRD